MGRAWGLETHPETPAHPLAPAHLLSITHPSASLQPRFLPLMLAPPGVMSWLGDVEETEEEKVASWDRTRELRHVQQQL